MKRSLRTRTPLALAVAASIAALTSTVAWAGAVDDLHAFAAETKTAKGSFVQRVQSRTKASPASSGDFVFARPGRFRWTYTKPYAQVLVADGEKLSIYDHDLNQVTVRKLGDALGSTPAAILFGSGDLDQQFTLIDTGTRGGVAWLDATPKARNAEGNAQFDRISIGFRNGELAAMELRDVLGQTTTLEFDHVERNPKVDASTFTFTPPAGVDVVRE